jgi:hypothetical protein
MRPLLSPSSLAFIPLIVVTYLTYLAIHLIVIPLRYVHDRSPLPLLSPPAFSSPRPRCPPLSTLGNFLLPSSLGPSCHPSDRLMSSSPSPSCPLNYPLLLQFSPPSSLCRCIFSSFRPILRALRIPSCTYNFSLPTLLSAHPLHTQPTYLVVLSPCNFLRHYLPVCISAGNIRTMRSREDVSIFAAKLALRIANTHYIYISAQSTGDTCHK